MGRSGLEVRRGRASHRGGGGKPGRRRRFWTPDSHRRGSRDGLERGFGGRGRHVPIRRGVVHGERVPERGLRAVMRCPSGQATRHRAGRVAPARESRRGASDHGRTRGNDGGAHRPPPKPQARPPSRTEGMGSRAVADRARGCRRDRVWRASRNSESGRNRQEGRGARSAVPARRRARSSPGDGCHPSDRASLFDVAARG